MKCILRLCHANDFYLDFHFSLDLESPEVIGLLVEYLSTEVFNKTRPQSKTKSKQIFQTC